MQMSFTDHATATAGRLAPVPKKKFTAEKLTQGKPFKKSKYQQDLDRDMEKAKNMYKIIGKNNKKDLDVIKNMLVDKKKGLKKMVVKGKEYLDQVDRGNIQMTKEVEDSEREAYTKFRKEYDRAEHELRVLEEVIEQFKNELGPPVRH